MIFRAVTADSSTRGDLFLSDRRDLQATVGKCYNVLMVINVKKKS